MKLNDQTLIGVSTLASRILAAKDQFRDTKEDQTLRKIYWLMSPVEISVLSRIFQSERMGETVELTEKEITALRIVEERIYPYDDVFVQAEISALSESAGTAPHNSKKGPDSNNTGPRYIDTDWF